jgi:hypothetical protein
MHTDITGGKEATGERKMGRSGSEQHFANAQEILLKLRDSHK